MTLRSRYRPTPDGQKFLVLAIAESRDVAASLSGVELDGYAEMREPQAGVQPRQLVGQGFSPAK